MLSHTIIALTVVSFSFHPMFCSPLSSHYGNTFFLFFTSQHESKPHNFSLICAFFKENSNLVVSILGITPKQKSHFSLLVSCPILLFFSSFHKRGLLGQNHGFKNRTGPAGPTGSTGNRPLIRSGYTKKPEIS